MHHIPGIILFAVLFTFSACRKPGQNCGLECELQEEMIFQTQFEGSTITNEGNTATLSGIDMSLDSLSDWATLEEHPRIGSVKINYEGGEISQRFAEITADPLHPDNEVLHFKIIEPHIRAGGGKKKGRVQLTLADNQCIKEYYQTVSLYLPPDMEYLTQWEEKFSWLSLFEFWNNANWTGEKNPFRVTVNIVKTESGPTNALYFQAKADHQTPFGKWMKIEVYIKEVDENNGRFYMSITPEGEQKTILFDIVGNTQHAKEKCPDGFSHFQPLKLYTSDRLIEFMKKNGKNLDVYWDAWKVYLDREP